MTVATMYQTILTKVENEIMYITINRESKLNALNIQTLRDIKEAVLSTYNNPDVKGIILTGAGTKAFAAGADIAEFSSFGVEEGTRMSADGHAVMNVIEKCSKPVIAAVSGFALGGGCELAMACHIRVAAENAKFGQPEINLAIIPGYGGTQRLPQLVGKGRALELLLTADSINAQEAFRLGLINHIVPQEQLITKCEEILNKIRTKSPLAVSAIINSVNASYEKKMDGNEFEINEFGNSFGSEDFKEGTQAFIEKRKADFKGR